MSEQQSPLDDLNELVASLHAAMEPNIRAAVKAVNQVCAVMAPQIRAAEKAAGEAMVAFAKSLPPLVREVPRD